ncbi:Cytochrome C oxidase, cbb3-type, subunit III [Duganella sp. CF458]|uniref:c-type cytochrome n=1 Tax=Duganella sp. CF458 TaxID=1884368 RepID=UPI0008E965B9|nr:cytochrome c [Duganella sp. CF458]SFG82552.1 Cytochrome C oxidase, cbb3-type, subunit III [Duganella sp. CF458]
MIDKNSAAGGRKFPLQGTVSSALAAAAISASLLYLSVVEDTSAQEGIRPAYTADYVAQMLDYVSRDYALAVSNGKIIDEDEYVEQLVVSGSALEVGDQVKAIKAQPAIRGEIVRLIDLIKEKAQPEVIKKQALKARDAIYVAAGSAIAPRSWPSLAQGKQIFTANCASCHGAMGDGRGIAAQALASKPMNFLDSERMAPMAPLSIFTSAKMGVQNTAMPGFSSLTEDELWAVSFYVLSLRPRMALPAAAKLDQTAADLWLKAAATLPDEELMQTLPGSSSERRKSLALLRTHSEDRK